MGVLQCGADILAQKVPVQRDWILHYQHPEPHEVCQQKENRIPDPSH